MDRPTERELDAEEELPRPLFTACSTLTWEHARTMNRELAGPSRYLLSGIILNLPRFR